MVENLALKMGVMNCHLSLLEVHHRFHQQLLALYLLLYRLVSRLINGHQWTFHDPRRLHHLLQET